MKWNNRVVRVTVAGVVAGTLAIACMGASTQVVSSKDTAKTPNPVVETTDQALWEQLRQAEMTSKSDTLTDWAVINGMPLAPKVEGIDTEFSAVASVLMWMDVKIQPDTRRRASHRISGESEREYEHILSTLSALGLVDPSRQKKTPEEKLSNVVKYFGGWWEGAPQSERERNWEKVESRLGSDAAGAPPCGLVLVHYLKELADNPSIAVQKYWALQLCQAIERRFLFDGNCGKLLLDNGIPFILKAKGTIWVCFGYVEEKPGGGRFLAVDASRIGLLLKNGKEISADTADAHEIKKKNGASWDGAQDYAVYADVRPFPTACTFISWPSQGEMVVASQPFVSIPLARKLVK